VNALALSFVLVGAAALVLPYLDRTDNRARAAVFAVATLFTWRYVAWRFTATLPPLAPIAASLYPWLFFVLELISAIGATIGFVTFSRTLDRRDEATEYRNWLERLPILPRVDVLIATYNEDLAILSRTIVGALAIDFPNVRVWVLDDGRRQWLEQLCAEKGAGYLTRPDHRHAKAGNLNHAIETLRCSPDPPDFVAVFDADFIAQPRFLSRTLPLFHDERVGVVQTPQQFFNNDPIQSNLLIGHVWPDEQRFFFNHILPSKDAWGAAFCCGTSSVIRMKALDAIGGFSTESVTEDFLITLKLDCRGWRTVYLNEGLSAGLAPEGIAEYLTQRGRWCLGFMQIVRSPFGPFSREPLSLAHRIGLIDTFLYWTASFLFKFACLLVPAIYWFTGLNVVVAPLDDIVGHFVPYYLSVMVAFGWATGGLIQPVLTDVAQLLAMFEVLRAAVIGLFKPRGHPFKVTAKGGRRDQLRIAWPMLGPFGLIAGLTLVGMLYGTLADFAPSHARFDAKVINLAWSLYNIVVLLIAMSVCIELPRYRREERFPTAEPVEIRAGGHVFTANLADISLSGVRILAPCPLPVGGEVSLILQHVGEVRGRIAVGSERVFAVEFLSGDRARDALIRKLFSGRYARQPAAVRSGRVVGAIFARLLR
jgi:cellulose synthase (UDP-forming)